MVSERKKTMDIGSKERYREERKRIFISKSLSETFLVVYVLFALCVVEKEREREAKDNS